MAAEVFATTRFSAIRTRYRIDADNTDQELAAFIEFIDSHCPVMDTMVNTPAFEHSVERAHGTTAPQS